MQKVFELIGKIHSTRTSVLITGESGTGKELVARALHTEGSRAQRAVRRGQLRRDSRGADGVGAVRPREGRVHRRGRRQAPACSRRPTAARCSSTRSASCRSALQVKLLRALQERKVKPVGAHRGARGRRPRGRRDQPRSRGRGRARRVPRGPLLPAQRDRGPAAAAAPAPRGHPAARRALPAPLRHRARPRASRCRPRRCASSRATTSPATSASSRT